MISRRVLFLGAPGAGKGTQAQRICAEDSLAHLSTGDLLRAAVKAETDAGKRAQSVMESGGLVQDEIVFDVLFDRLSEVSDAFVLDGFPRNLSQAEELADRLNRSNLSLDVVIDLDVPEEALIRRLTGRRICKLCGSNFHQEWAPTAVEGVCDHCGGDTYQRTDDDEATARHRLSVYQKETEPLKRYYEGLGLLVTVNGDQSIDRVTNDIREVLLGEVSGESKHG